MHPSGDFVYPVTAAYLGASRFGKDAAILSFATPHGELVWEGELEGEWLAKTVKSLKVAGWTGDDLSTVTALVGKTVPLWIKHKTSAKGKTFVQVYISAGTGGATQAKPADPSRARDIAASLKSRIAALKDEPEPPPRRAAVPPPFLDDDVPFSLLLVIGLAASVWASLGGAVA